MFYNILFILNINPKYYRLTLLKHENVHKIIYIVPYVLDYIEIYAPCQNMLFFHLKYKNILDFFFSLIKIFEHIPTKSNKKPSTILHKTNGFYFGFNSICVGVSND